MFRQFSKNVFSNKENFPQLSKDYEFFKLYSKANGFEKCLRRHSKNSASGHFYDIQRVTDLTLNAFH